MEKGFLDRVEDNTAVRTWVEMTQRGKGDSLAEGYVSELWDFTRVSVTQKNLQELKEIWNQWNNERLMSIMGMSEQWVTARIKQKGDSKCIPWKNLKDLILAHPDVRKKVDVFALSIYGLVVFPKALEHVDEAITNLFDRLEKRVTPVPAILAETFRSLNACRRAGEGDSGYTIGYAPLLVLRQYRLRQFVPTTQGLAECEFSYRGDGYRKRIREMVNEWSHTHRMKRLAVGPMTTPEYSEWWDFERRNAELEKKIEQIEEEKVNLRLDVDVQKLEADKLRKGKNNAEEELDSLKTDYKKLQGQAQNEALEKSLSDSQKENGELKDRVVELEGCLCQHRSQNSVVELKASPSKIEEMKGKIEGLEVTLRNCEVQIEHLEVKESRQNEQLHYFQNQVKDRDHVMGEAVVQIREVADHLQALAVQADTLSVKYELESSRGQELALLLKKIKVLSIRAKPYL
ncbi:hypothetical protein Gotur_024582 [Gossypium turneri]